MKFLRKMNVHIDILTADLHKSVSQNKPIFVVSIINEENYDKDVLFYLM